MCTCTCKSYVLSCFASGHMFMNVPNSRDVVMVRSSITSTEPLLALHLLSPPSLHVYIVQRNHFLYCYRVSELHINASDLTVAIIWLLPVIWFKCPPKGFLLLWNIRLASWLVNLDNRPLEVFPQAQRDVRMQEERFDFCAKIQTKPQRGAEQNEQQFVTCKCLTVIVLCERLHKNLQK